MHLENFPMDTQKCPLTFGSCKFLCLHFLCGGGGLMIQHLFMLPVGYSIRDVLYRWNAARQIAIADDMKLSQFDLIATPAGNRTDILKSGRLCSWNCDATTVTETWRNATFIYQLFIWALILILIAVPSYPSIDSSLRNRWNFLVSHVQYLPHSDTVDAVHVHATAYPL